MFFAKLNKPAQSGSSSEKPDSKLQSPSVKIKTVKIKRAAPPKAVPSTSSSDLTSNISRFARYPGSPESRSGSSTPKRNIHDHKNGDGNQNSGDESSGSTHSRKIQRRSSSASSKGRQTRNTARRGNKTPDLSRFNRATSDDDEIDDSNWEAQIRKFSSSTRITDTNSGSPTPSVGSKSQQTQKGREFYAGILNEKSAPLNIIHAKKLVEFAEYTPLFKHKKDFEYTLAMPCTSFRERYVAAVPKSADEFNPVFETERVMELVANFFVPETYTPLIRHPSLEDCIIRRYRRAVKDQDSEGFLKSIEEYNTLIDKLRSDGTIDKYLLKQQETRWDGNNNTLPLPISRFILDQVYARVVSPVTDSLRDYKAFSNNVYGELLPVFMTRVFKEAGLEADMKFIDLGSGVGNCVLQAALEIGCESWGCEVMKTASQLAVKQKQEIKERVKMYGIKLGVIEVRSADFVHNDEIHKQISEADVLLVNNYAFDGKLNSHLIDIFLDLKEGARIISLKSFVPPGHVISQHNIQSPVNLLRVEPKEFPTGSVSWTMASGQYYLSTVDRTRLDKFLKDHGMI